ncbi:MAG: Hsp20/alpha crystallin family protein [Elusimicrobiota bacterium]|nr:Hsp20/alpha crystallin family protein [Elusimicrobiota bacterium]
MNHKHAVQTKKHATHTVQSGKHQAHAVQSRNHTPRTVQPGNQAAVMLRPFESLGSVFEDMLELPMVEEKAIYMPPVDIRETDKTIEVSVELQGFDKKDINLYLTEDTLAISCERREENNEKDAGGYRLQEQSYGRFYRAFTLPAAIKTGDTKAVYKNGMLRIAMQKQKPGRYHQLKVE